MHSKQEAAKSYSHILRAHTYPNKENAVIMNRIPETEITDYIIAFENIIDLKNITDAYPMSYDRVVIFLKTKELAEQITEQYTNLKVKGIEVPIRKLLNSNKRMILTVPAYIPNEILTQHLKFLKINLATAITHLKLSNDPKLAHINSGRRQVFYVPDPENNIPDSFTIDYANEICRIFISIERCENCYRFGHITQKCRNSPQAPMIHLPPQITNPTNINNTTPHTTETLQEPQAASKTPISTPIPSPQQTTELVTEVMDQDLPATITKEMQQSRALGKSKRFQAMRHDSTSQESDSENRKKQHTIIEAIKAPITNTSDAPPSEITPQQEISKPLEEKIIQKTNMIKTIEALKYYIIENPNHFPIKYSTLKKLMTEIQGKTTDTNIKKTLKMYNLTPELLYKTLEWVHGAEETDTLTKTYITRLRQQLSRLTASESATSDTSSTDEAASPEQE